MKNRKFINSFCGPRMIPKQTNRIENNIYVLPTNIDTIILNKLLFKCDWLWFFLDVQTVQHRKIYHFFHYTKSTELEDYM